MSTAAHGDGTRRRLTVAAADLQRVIVTSTLHKPEAHDLASRIAAQSRLRAILALGRIAHDATLAALGVRKAAHPFAHGAEHHLTSGVTLFDSFHCSRYNTSTRRLTPEMFDAVLARIRSRLDAG